MSDQKKPFTGWAAGNAWLCEKAELTEVVARKHETKGE